MIQRNILKKQNGSSVVSVMVAFLILLIGLSMFSVAAVTSIDITNKSKDMRDSVKEAMHEYYEGSPELNKSGIKEYEFSGKDDATSFKIDAKLAEFVYQSERNSNIKVSLYFFEKPK